MLRLLLVAKTMLDLSSIIPPAHLPVNQ